MKTRGVTATRIITAAAACILIPAFTYAAPAIDPRPWMDVSLPPMKRAELLVHATTLDEKIEQIHMADVKSRPREVPGIERLGIPTFKITNGPAGAGPGDSQVGGAATALPSALALSATWDPTLAAIFGEIAGKETAARGEHLIEAPGVNIIRVPQNGRNFEYFGEDPYLAGQMAVPEIEAIQKQGVIAEVKIYVRAPALAGEPPHQLKGFDKIRLEPQEARHVSVTLDAGAFSSWDTAQKRWRFVPGRHQILVGESSRDLSLQGAATIRSN